MMWQTIEVSAIIVECFLAIYFNVNYFKMKDNKYVFFKIFVGTLILSLELSRNVQSENTQNLK